MRMEIVLEMNLLILGEMIRLLERVVGWKNMMAGTIMTIDI